jgi:hypothetical protein
MADRLNDKSPIMDGSATSKRPFAGLLSELGGIY